MTVRTETLQRTLAILGWLFFRTPEAGWRRHAVAALIALLATLAAVTHSHFFASFEKVGDDGHARLSLEEALVLHSCGKYGYVGNKFGNKYRTGTQFLTSDSAPPREPYSAIIAEKYGSVASYCDGAREPILNNENSLFLLDSFLLALPPDDSPNTLALKLEGFRCGALFVALYTLAFFGVGLLPLTFISLAATQIMELIQQTQALSMYPTLPILTLLSSALLVVLLNVIKGRRFRSIVIASAAFGLLLAFIYNFRSSYGFFVVAQIVVLLAIDAVQRWRSNGKVARYAAAVLSIAIAAAAFQAILIKPLQDKNIAGHNYAYHVIWHSVVIGLANPPNPLATREGIQWKDAVGADLAKRVDPKAEYLGPRYEAALRKYYFGLWRDHPAAMLDIYHRKVFETSRTMMASLRTIFGSPALLNWEQRVIPNGYVWYYVLLAAGLLGLLACKIEANIGTFVTLLTTGLICISLEQTIVIPYFYVQYQGGLIVGLAALVALGVVLGFAGLPRVAASLKAVLGTRTSGEATSAVAVPVDLRRRAFAARHAVLRPAPLLIVAAVAGGWLLSQVPLPSNIMPLADGAWDKIFAPARLIGGEVEMAGSPVRTGYAAISGRYRLPKGVTVGAAGTVKQGGMMFGILDSQGRWAAARSLLSGPFSAELEVPADGEYRIVLANNPPPGATINKVEVKEVGLVAVDPAQYRLDPLNRHPETTGVDATNLQITPLGAAGWKQILPPARLDGAGLRLDGAPATATAYAAQSHRYRLSKGAVVAAAGNVERGGIMFGVFDDREHWATAVAIPQGPFRTAVEIPTVGDYRIVIGNNLPAGQTINDVTLTEVGLAGLDPAALRVKPTEPEITPLGIGAWDTVYPPARVTGKGLRIEGAVAIPAAYGAVSAYYRLPKGELVAAAGTVMNGGIVLGLLDSRGQWATTAAIPPGVFRTTVQAPADGKYRIVIANNLPAGQTANDAEVTEVGLVGLDPAALRVATAASKSTASEPKAEPPIGTPFGLSQKDHIDAH